MVRMFVMVNTRKLKYARRPHICEKRFTRLFIFAVIYKAACNITSIIRELTASLANRYLYRRNANVIREIKTINCEVFVGLRIGSRYVILDEKKQTSVVRYDSPGDV